MPADDTLFVRSPYDDTLLAELPLATTAELERALTRAKALFDDRSGWLPALERRSILQRFQGLVAERVDELARQAAAEGGKPLMDSLVEVRRAVEGVGVAIEEMARLTGREIAMGLNPASRGHGAFTWREPRGVVAAISAFNHPFNLIIHQVIPAVATGCPVIVKPAGTTPLSALTIAELLAQAGLPDGWVQVLVCRPPVAALLAADRRLGFLTFIGSGRVGWELRSRLAPGVTCTLEHGGAAPVLIEPDADLDDALPRITKGGFYHAGQVCVSVQRLFVHADVAQQVAEGLATAARGLIVGDPLAATTEVGPLISRAEVDRVEAWVHEAEQQGGRVLCGGERIGASCFAPTVIVDPPDTARVAREEIFGPVVVIFSYRERDEAIRRANQLDYCFQAAVFTKNLDVALDCARRLKATAVMINEHSAFRVDWMPFGGRGASGLGMGGIGETMLDMTAEKLMVVQSPAFG